MKSHIEVLAKDLENARIGKYTDILVNEHVLSLLIVTATADPSMPGHEYAYRELHMPRVERG